ncbi:MAG: alpha/beta fold hydrolase [Gemmatimonadales bacterium]
MRERGVRDARPALPASHQFRLLTRGLHGSRPGPEFGEPVHDESALRQLFREIGVGPRGITVPRLVLAGHSEGAVVASVIATEGAAADGVVLLSGPSLGILGIMIEQARGMLPPGGSDQPVRLLERIVVHIRRGEPIPEDLRAKAGGDLGAGALAKMPPEAIAYMRDCDATDPAATIARYDKPVLIIQGGADTSVPPHHAERLRDARGSRPTTHHLLDGLSHMYKPVPEGASPMEIFGLAGPTDPRVAEAIDNFVRAL